MRAAILIVAGDRSVARIAAAALRGPYEVDVARTGAAALARVEADPPDCIVVDHRLPDMDGLDCLTAVRARRPVLSVIITADAGGEAIAVEALQRGATDYVLRYPD